MIICLCLLFAGRASAQWVVSDPGNLAQGIINASKNIIHTSKTATNMVSNFQETVKIYQQGKKYYDALKSVNNLVKDARKVQQTILMVGDITAVSYTHLISPTLANMALDGLQELLEKCIKKYKKNYKQIYPKIHLVPVSYTHLDAPLHHRTGYATTRLRV